MTVASVSAKSNFNFIERSLTDFREIHLILPSSYGLGQFQLLQRTLFRTRVYLYASRTRYQQVPTFLERL